MNRTSSGLSNSSQSNNHRKNHKSGLSIEKVIPGFIQYKSADGLSLRTLVGYEHDLNLWLEIQGDRNLTQVTTQELREFLSYIRMEYTPRRITGNNDRKLSRRTIRNIWISLSAFFSWACDEFDLPSPMRGVPAPKYAEAQVETFTKEEIEALL